MDGVFFPGVNFWAELHKKFGTWEEGKKLTEKYLYTDYPRLVDEVVGGLWKGKDAAPYWELVENYEYLDGVKELFGVIKSKDFITMIITGGSIDLARRIQKEYGIDHVFGNELVIQDNKVTGEFVWPIGSGGEKKVSIIEHMCEDLDITPEEILYIGDAEPDIEAFKFVGTSIAFNCKVSELKELATHVVDSKDLKDLIKFIE